MRDNAIVVAGEAGILSTIPVILGFHPQDSIVVVALIPVGRRLRLGPVMRVDFPTGEALSSTLGHAAVLSAKHTDTVAIVLYHPEASGFYDEEILPFFAGLSVLTVLRVTDQAPQILDARVEAASVLAGRRVLGSRTELVASVAHRPGNRVDTQLISHFTDAASRDDYLIEHLTDQDTLPDLIAAAQKVPDYDHRAAHLCAALAAVAYHHGDGALAQAACARALTIDTGNRFARLLVECISVGMPPHELANGLLGP